MEKQEYSMYEIITMTPGMAGEVLCDECEKEKPNIDLIKNILEHSQIEDVNVQNGYGYTALMLASGRGHTEIVRMLLEHPKIDVNVHSLLGIHGHSNALTIAFRKGYIEIFKLLLANPKTNVNAQNQWGETALMFASSWGRTEIVRMLLEHPEILVNVQDKWGETALQRAYIEYDEATEENEDIYYDIIQLLESEENEE